MTEKFFEDDLTTAQSKVSDLSLVYKQLRMKHYVSMHPDSSERTHKVVYFSKPDTVYVKDPEVQRKFRDEAITSISQAPLPKSVRLYSDELLSEYLKLDQESSPQTVRQALADFYFKQACKVQQRKFKTLLKWSYLSQVSKSLPVAELNEQLKNLHETLDNHLARIERLRYNEDFPGTAERPHPTTKDNTLLFEESPAVSYSNISKSDVHDYLQIKVESLNNKRLVKKFLLRTKWIWVSERFAVWKKALENLCALKQLSIERMKVVTGNEEIGKQKIEVNVITNVNLRNIKRQQEIMRRAKAVHSTFAEEHLNLNEQLLNSYKDEIDTPPLLITSTKQLQGLLEIETKDFGLTGDLQLDDGHSLTYQVTHMLPEQFELQKQKLDWQPYDIEDEKKKASIRTANLQALRVHKLSNAKTSVNEKAPQIPRRNPETVCVKKPDWLGVLRLKPEIAEWQRKQRSECEQLQRADTLLRKSFELLDVQDLPTINRILEELSTSYTEKATHKAALKTEIGMSNTEMRKKFFSALLAEESLSKEKVEQEKVDLASQSIKAFFTLKLLKNRNMKQKLLEVLNVFRSIQRRLAFDISDLSSREELNLENSDHNNSESVHLNPVLPNIDLPLANYLPSNKPFLYGRQDKIETVEGTYYVRDETGQFVFYSCAEEDYNELKEELMKLGSFYIEKYESWCEDEGESYQAIDRDLLTSELLQEEANFQETKLKLVLLYMEFYEHAIQKSEQTLVAQQVTDLMALRPRLYLKGSYFTQSYWAHIEALKSQTNLLKAIFNQQVLANHHKVKNNPFEFIQSIPLIPKVPQNIYKTLEELKNIHETSNVLELSCMEKALWETANDHWRAIQCSPETEFESGVLLDNPVIGMNTANHLSREVKTGEHPLLPVFPAELFEGSAGKIEVDTPSELQLVCNYVKAWDYRKNLEKTLEETNFLEGIYRSQSKEMKKQVTNLEAANWNMNARNKYEVDEGPGLKSNFWLQAFEFDPYLKANFHLANERSLRSLILPAGLVELKAITQYQVMHTHLLRIGVQVNENAMDKWHRQLVEIELAETKEYVPRKSTAVWSNILGRKGDGLKPDKADNEKKRLQSRIVMDAGKHYFSLKDKKMNHRPNSEEAYKRILGKYKNVLRESPMLPLIMRNLRARVVDGYCREVLRETYHYAIKVQTIKVLREFRSTLRILPREEFSNYFDSQEHQVLVDENGIIKNIKYLPSTEDILEIQVLSDQDKQKWKNWEPFLSAETPEVVKKKLKAPKEPPSTTPSNLLIKNSWNFVSQIKSTLECLISIQRIFQIKVFNNFLSQDRFTAMDLFDQTLEGNNFWEKEPTDQKEFSHRVVDQMLEVNSPRYGLMESIKRALGMFDSLSSEIAEVHEHQHIAYLTMKSFKCFQSLVAYLFHLLHNSVMNDKQAVAKRILNFLTYLCRFSRKTTILKDKPLSVLDSKPTCKPIELLESVMGTLESSKSFVQGSNLEELSWGLFDIEDSERGHAMSSHTALKMRLEQYITAKRLKDQPYESVETLLNFLKLELECWKLKYALFVCKTGDDVVTDPSLYEKLSYEYRDVLEWKSNTVSGNYAEREISKLTNELKISREYFQNMLSECAVKFLTKEIENLSEISKRTGEQYGVKEDFSCNFDNNYSDVTRKIGVLHNFLNTLRNRCTVVESPTSGKSLVFSIKDLTQLTKRFAEQIMRYAESEIRLREESYQLEIEHLQNQLKHKEKTNRDLKKSVDTMKNNIESLVNAQLSQKGNQLIFELDIAHRQLHEIKSHLSQLEKQMKQQVYMEFREEMEKKDLELSNIKANFKSFRQEVSQQLKSDIDSNKTEGISEFQRASSKVARKQITQLLDEENKSIQEKYENDILLHQETIRKMRTLHQWARFKMKQKFENRIKDLRSQLSSNQYLWEQLNESQRREALLKQELSYTQQALASAEKLADKLQSQIEDMNNQRLRLQQYKATKGKRLAELEKRNKEFQKVEFIDNTRLLGQLYQQNKQLHQLKACELDAAEQYRSQYTQFNKQMQLLKKQLKQERKLKTEAFDQLNMFKEELKGVEQDPASMEHLWKQRYYDLLDEFRSFKATHSREAKRPESDLLPAIGSYGRVSSSLASKHTD